ncbi:lysophospholipid acyltransferase family protein [Parahaliea mediterranea]|uniref:lysophospholipid acyltransferase family protein n=1 Tax=Parahaliea mediterranea TaxID=651086 RepID=UPI000E2EA057|nr:lysophospholipid acyltransferase family protein [Parahaliea mediterranea]
MGARQDGFYWRVAATGTSFALFGLGGLVLGYVIFPVVSLLAPDRDTAVRRCRGLIHHSFRLFIGFMKGAGVLTWDVQGAAELRTPGQLVVANHPTLIDIVFLISMIPDATCIVKSDLYRNPFTRGPVRLAGYVANDSPEQLLRDGAAAIDSGTTLVVFPEGSRSVGSDLLTFRRGAAYLWLAARCPLRLVTITASPPTLAKGEKWYQIPHRRPHFHLAVRQWQAAEQAQPPAGSSARDVTREWQQYFHHEISA